MLTISKTASTILDKIIAAGNGEDAFTIDNAAGAFMPLHFEELPPITVPNLGFCSVYSLAHYYEQNGDMMRDPEMCVLETLAGQRIPYYYRLDSMGVETYSVCLEKGGFYPVKYGELIQFFNMWMSNIQQQQEL